MKVVEGKSAWVGIAIATQTSTPTSAWTGSVTTTTATSTPSWPSALTIKESNVPEAQFNEDGKWLPYLLLINKDDHLVDHRVDHPRARKSAGFKQIIQQAPLVVAAAAVAAESAGPAAVVEHDKSAPPPLKKARHGEKKGVSSD